MMKGFVAYSKSDSGAVGDLMVHLKGLKHRGIIDMWYDHQLIPSGGWDENIRAEIRKANLIIFCVSADLLASDYIQKVELPIALSRHNNREATVIPVIFRRCLWKSSKLGRLQGIPAKGKTVRDYIRNKRSDDVFTEVASAIYDAVQAREEIPDRSNPASSGRKAPTKDWIHSSGVKSVEQADSSCLQHFNLFSIHKCVRSDTVLGYPYIAVDDGRRYFMEISDDHIVLEEFDEEKLGFMADHEKVRTIQPLEIDADGVYDSALREYMAFIISFTVFSDNRILVVAANDIWYSEWESSLVDDIVYRVDRKFVDRSKSAEGAPIIQLDNGSVRLPASTSEYKCVRRMGRFLSVLDVVASLSRSC